MEESSDWRPLIHRTRIPRRTALLQSASGQVMAAVSGPDGFKAVPMGEAPRVLAAIAAPVAFVYPPAFGVMTRCHRRLTPDDAVGEFVTWMKARVHRAREAEARIQRALNADDPSELLLIIEGLDRVEFDDFVGSLIGKAYEKHESVADVRVAYARALAHMGQWGKLAQLLAPVDPNAVDPASRRHLHHLLAVAHLQLGNAVEARKELELGKRHDGLCELEWLQASAMPLDQAPSKPWRPDAAALRRSLDAIARADQALEEGNAPAALALLDTWAIWERAEVQSLARTAQACVDREPGKTGVDPGSGGGRDVSRHAREEEHDGFGGAVSFAAKSWASRGFGWVEAVTSL